MNPAEKLAALRLLEHGLKAAIADATEEADAYRQQVRAKSLETDYGPVTLARRKATVVITDEAEMLAWVEDTMPQLVVRTIAPETRSWLTSTRLKVSGDEVIDPATGEVVPFAAARQGAEYLTFRPTQEARDAAIAAVASRLDSLTATIAPPLEES